MRVRGADVTGLIYGWIASTIGESVHATQGRLRDLRPHKRHVGGPVGVVRDKR